MIWKYNRWKYVHTNMSVWEIECVCGWMSVCVRCAMSVRKDWGFVVYLIVQLLLMPVHQLAHEHTHTYRERETQTQAHFYIHTLTFFDFNFAISATVQHDLVHNGWYLPWCARCKRPCKCKYHFQIRINALQCAHNTHVTRCWPKCLIKMSTQQKWMVWDSRNWLRITKHCILRCAE